MASFVAVDAVAAVGLTVVTALEVTAAVGATPAAVGAVTKDKALTLAGTVIGAVGAIVGLAAGAGLLGDAAASDAPLFGPAPAAGTADEASAGTVDAMSGGVGAAGDTSGLINADITPGTPSMRDALPLPGRQSYPRSRRPP